MGEKKRGKEGEGINQKSCILGKGIFTEKKTPNEINYCGGKESIEIAGSLRDGL